VGTDPERPEAEAVLHEAAESGLDLVGKTTIGQLGAVLEQCTVTIANDGGVAHLSAAAGTPVVAIFGPSNDDAWRPLLSTVIASDIPCRPCFYRGFERGLPNGCETRECLALVTPKAVAMAAVDYLERASVAV
jgi:heptosyltransferase-2